MSVAKKSFHERLRETRENAGQSAEVMSILLSMDEGDYQSLEQGETFPDNETLKRLCMMMEWNYYDTRRLIANEMTAPLPDGIAPGTTEDSAFQALHVAASGASGQSTPRRFDTLGSRLKEVRLQTGQTVDIIGKLLNIEPDVYRQMEAGEHPTDDLLKRISIIYDWNFYDLITLLRSERAKELQPRQIGNPFPGATELPPRLKTLLDDMQGQFVKIQSRDQKMILSQLELVLETMRRMQPFS